MPHIVSICYTPDTGEPRPEDHYARVPMERATLIEAHGIEGDRKARKGKGKRQLNLMRAETTTQLQAEGFRAGPGELGEQIVIAGLEASAFVPGVRLRLGTAAVIGIDGPRTPCDRFARIQGKTIKDASGRIGVMARVLAGGEIAVGQEVAIMSNDARIDLKEMQA